MSEYEEAKVLAQKNYCADYQAGNPCEACTMQAALIQAADKEIATKDAEIARLKKEKAAYDGLPNVVRDALKELVELKRIKDVDGKTEDYLKRQPLAWAKAKEALNE